MAHWNGHSLQNCAIHTRRFGYISAIGLNLSEGDIKNLVFSGQQSSKEFKSYITDLAKNNNSTYEKEKSNYDTRVSNLIYQKKDEKK
ncbi:hypothetical protein QLS31_01605 [Flavobacterium sp. XS2P24]|uniref:hypothetical protein n=1 Tax=Flavobacterium sp. XS2P24 TaxID=3041249 RepID=UPI0024A8E61D|nr:hypothetical protein [Flavobacterium sp. XS2P24]MDI6048519.1 hypothetical protein [Flavobacterium sp. XS2P24]